MAASGYTPISLYHSTTAAAVPLAANLVPGELAINTNDGKLYYENSSGVVTLLASSAGASGDVVGPASSTDNAVARFDGTTGKAIQNSVVTIADSTGDMAGVGTLSSGAITTTGVLTLPAGTVSAPAITTTGDTNTGIFFPAADTIAFTEGGVEAMRIDSDGDVGIGTTSPAAKLHISVATAAVNQTQGVRVTNPAGTAVMLECGSSNDSFVGTTSGSDFNIRTNNTERMRVDTAGNVGIGTSSPSVKLEVSGRVLGDSLVAGNAVYIWSQNRMSLGASYGIESQQNSPLFMLTQGVAQPIVFGTNSAERMRIDSSGNVGIGTSSPSAKLNVIGGNIRLDNNQGLEWAGSNNYIYGNETTDFVGIATNGNERMRIDSSGNVCVGSTAAGNAGALNVSVGLAGTTVGGLQLWSTTNSTHYVNFGDGTTGTDTYRGYVGYAHGSDALLFGTSTAERMRITSGGDVLIGTTTNTGSRKVNVVGNIAATNTDAVDNQLVIGADANVAFVAATYGSTGAYKPLTFNTNGAEKARITTEGYLKASNTGVYVSSTGIYHEMVSDGNNTSLIVRNTNGSLTAGGVLYVDANRNTTNNAFYAISYYNNGAGAFKFQVADSGNVTNTNGSYGTISDIKNKENIVDATSKLDKVNQLKVRNYNFIGDDLKQIGFVAQEFEQVFPSMVEEHSDKDADGNDLGTTTKSIKTSVLVPILVKAIQELNAKVEAQAAEIALLKSK
jgi:hypothetical protein